MSSFRSRQRAIDRRQPLPTAPRNAPPAGQTPAPRAEGDRPHAAKGRDGKGHFDRKPHEGKHGFEDRKPRFGDRPPREGGFDKPRFGDRPPREGGFDKPRFGDRPPREGGFDKPRFGDRPPREGGFDKPRFGDRPPREGGRDFEQRKPRFEDRQPREGGFDKPRFGDRPPREGGFDKPRFGDRPPREGGFDKPRFGDRPPREGGFDKPRFGDRQPREGGFDKPRFGDRPPREGGRDFEQRKPLFGDRQPREEGRDFEQRKPCFEDRQPRGGGRDFEQRKPLFGDRQPREEGRDFEQRKPHFEDRQPREGGRDFEQRKPRFEDRQPREEGRSFEPRTQRYDDRKPRFEGRENQSGDNAAAADTPKVLFGQRKPEAAAAANPAPAADDQREEKRYTRDRVAGRGQAHPDFKPQERREQPEPVRPKSFLKSRREQSEDGDEAPARDARQHGDNGGFNRNRTFDEPQHRPADAPRGLGNLLRRREENTDGEQDSRPPRQEREERKPWQDEARQSPRFARDGERQPREGGFDKPRFGDRQRDERRGFDERKPRFDDRQPRDRDQSFGDRKPLFGDRAPRDGGHDKPRHARSEGGARDGAANVGRSAYVKAAPRSLKEGQFALFATCPRGLEKLLAEEITTQGGLELQMTDGGVHFTGTAETMMRVNLHSRIASRLLQQLAHGNFQQERDIYDLARQIDWSALFDVACTIKVNTDGHARLKSLDYVSLLVKDAICDSFRAACGARPSVDTRHPDMRIRVFVSGFDVQIYLDTSGEALFKRGWRRETGEAPLRENLAAGILLAAGYDGTQALLDPMCGSGTFLAEAADIALNRAPGRHREYAFERFAGHNDILWRSLCSDAELAERPAEGLAIFGNDISSEMIEMARRNLAQCGLAEVVTLSQGDATELDAPAESGLIVCNPPYGVRLDEQDSLAELYPQLASWLKRGFAGWTAHLMTADERLPGLMRLQPAAKPMLYNGALECRVYAFPVVAGSNRKEKNDSNDQ